jgi:hypothetical protein
VRHALNKSEKNEETELISQILLHDKLNESMQTQDANVLCHIKEDTEILMFSPGHSCKLDMTFKPITHESQDDHLERRESQED